MRQILGSLDLRASVQGFSGWNLFRFSLQLLEVPRPEVSAAASDTTSGSSTHPSETRAAPSYGIPTHRLLTLAHIWRGVCLIKSSILLLQTTSRTGIFPFWFGTLVCSWRSVSSLSGPAEGICPAQCQDPQQILGECLCVTHRHGSKVKPVFSECYRVFPCQSLQYTQQWWWPSVRTSQEGWTHPFKHLKSITGSIFWQWWL